MIGNEGKENSRAERRDARCEDAVGGEQNERKETKLAFGVGDFRSFTQCRRRVLPGTARLSEVRPAIFTQATISQWLYRVVCGSGHDSSCDGGNMH